MCVYLCAHMCMRECVCTQGRRAVSTHSFEDADGLLAEPDRVQHVIVQDGLKQVVLIVGFKRGLPGHHLVHQHAEGPPVHGGTVLQFLQDLCRKCTSGTTKGVCTSQPKSQMLQERMAVSSCLLQRTELHVTGGGSQSAHSVRTECGVGHWGPTVTLQVRMDICPPVGAYCCFYLSTTHS